MSLAPRLWGLCTNAANGYGSELLLPEDRLQRQAAEVG